MLSPAAGATGTLVAHHEVAGAVIGTATQRADGAVIVPVYSGSGGTGALYRLREGRFRALYPGPATLSTAAASNADGVLVVGSTDGKVRALALDGHELWGFPTGGPIVADPAVAADGTVYVGSTDGKLYALKADGSQRWSYATGDWITAAASIGGDGTVYVGSTDGVLYALTSGGALRWRVNVGASIETPAALSQTGRLYVGTNEGEVLAVQTADGAILWRFNTGGIVGGSPVLGAGGTVYVGTLESPREPNDGVGYFHALRADGTLQWRRAVAQGVRSTAAVAADGTVIFGGGDGKIYAVDPTGAIRWSHAAGACVDAAPLLAADGTVCTGAGDGTFYVLGCSAGPAATDWPMFGGNPQRSSRDASASTVPTLCLQPQSRTVRAGAGTELAVVAAGSGLTYQWLRNGTPLVNASAAQLALANFKPANSGMYTVVVRGATTVASQPAIVGATIASKVAGEGEEVGADIRHANGNRYDQILLRGAGATITADPGQVTRLSFLDLNDDIVQVEFSGAGTLSLVLENPSGPTAPAKYNQSGVAYMKGHAGITIADADETTNVSVFSVGRMTAVNQGLFRREVFYDGLADVAFIAILSANGKFGGIRAANATFSASAGYTGIFAPGVEFVGPVYVGEIEARDAATAVLRLGSAPDVRITGGDLRQYSGPVQISGVARLKMADGTTSHGIVLAAQTIAGQLAEDGDVTAQLVVNPTRPAGPDPMRYGVHSVLEYGTPHGLINHVAALQRIGAQTSRNDFLWSQIEPEPGQFNWTVADEVVDALTAAGIEPLMVIWTSPRWANGSDDVSVVPTNESDFARWLAAYRNFARALAERYHDRVDHWELWNEPNLEEFWKPAPNVEAYARWATAIDSEIRAIDPLARVAYGSVTIPEVAYNERQIAGGDFIRGLYERHVRPRAVSVHPYMYENQPPEAGGPGDGKNTFRDVLVIRDVMLDYGSDEDIWITEYCWWAGPMFGNPSLSLTEQQQADYFAGSLEQIRRWPYVRRVVWFWDWDRPGSEFNGCGLIRVDGTLRPAALVLQNATK